MKSISKPKSLLHFIATLCVIIVTIVFLFSPCHAEQPSTTGNQTRDEILTPVITTGAEEASIIERRKREEQRARVSAFAITPHRQNYLFFVTYDSKPNKETYEFAAQDVPERYEVKFQLSFKLLLWEKMFGRNGDLFLGYTQRSFWQFYDKTLSSPFRETNHEPEIFVKFDTDFNVLGLRHRLFLIGFNHQSNGRGEPLSRSWNRVYAEFVAERGNFVIALKPWYRIPEKEEDDDNPDIEKYMGYGELIAAYWLKGHVFSIMLRNNMRGDENKGAVEIGWSFPITHNIRGFVQYFNGYGESLVDYNDTSNRIGLGVMLNDWI
jgi:phospholipase A1